MNTEIITNEISSLEELFSTLKNNKITYNYELITKASKFIEEKHKDQNRSSGESHYHHVLNVAYFIAQLKLDTTSIVTAFLHDTISKTNVTLDEIDELFGTDVAYLIEGLTKIKSLSKSYNPTHSGEEFTNLIFNASDDLRIILVRLADKLHNILTIKNIDIDTQKISAGKIKNIYAPLSEYMGLGSMQRILDDSAFKIEQPEMHNIVQTKILSLSKKEQNVINNFLKSIEGLLKKYSLRNFEIDARQKGVYSSFKKIFKKYIKDGKLTDEVFAELKDVFAFRVIVSNIEDCYKTLGAIHSEYEYSTSDFKDYISLPKENGYKSLHTVIFFEGNPVEVQIRTKEMHEFNEFGPACHIAYKLQGSKNSGTAFTWTKKLMGWKDTNLNELTKEDFKIGLFKESVFVFTPKGLVIRMKKGTTALDFAFRIHSELGTHYRGALVNKKMVKMDYQLKTGDVVEILKDSKVNVTYDWINIAKSNRTKDKIRKVLQN